MLAKYKGVVNKLLPRGTTRRGIYELGLIGVRTIINEGWRSFFRKLRLWLRLKRAAARGQHEQDRDSLLMEYWTFHPRYRFFKTLPLNSRVLDVGAGSGALYFWREWGRPRRNDIELHAVDLKKGEFFGFFPTFQIMNLEKDELHYPQDFFDAMIMSHCLEHIEKTNVVLSKLRSCLKPHGYLYIEMPTPQSLSSPRREYYLQQGLNVGTVSFDDDKTHVKVYTFQELFSLLNDSHFAVVEYGIIENKYLEDALFEWGSKNNDQAITTYAIHLKLRFAHYCIAERLE